MFRNRAWQVAGAPSPRELPSGLEVSGAPRIAESYDPAAVFEEQLEKCGVDYFDFYLLHNVYEASIDVYTDEKWGIADYFVEQKKAGRIRHLGFSCHGRPDLLAGFLDYGARKHAQLAERDPEAAASFAGGNIMEFCQTPDELP